MPVVKPAGPTSHDIVAAVRRALGGVRTGHLGTLDPFADGVLVVVVGRATRLAQFAGGWTKTYEGVMRLGVTTDTDDPTGAPVATSEAWRALTPEAVAAAFSRFHGTFSQRPPAFSAVKIAGERAYRRARRGESVAPSARDVTVFGLELAAFEPPDVRFRATVGGGTYLRSLARDVGEALGCGAHLAALTRTAVGPFGLADAVAPDAVTAQDVRPVDVLVADLPRHDLTDAERESVVHGRAVTEGRGVGDGGRVALFHGRELVAVAEAVDGVLRPRVVLADA